MAVQNYEMWRGITGDQDKLTVRYLVTGAATQTEVLDHMEGSPPAGSNPPNGTPFFTDGMSRENISVEEISAKDLLWYSNAMYTRRGGNKPAAPTGTQVNGTTSNPDSPDESDKDSYSFDVSVETVREFFPTSVQTWPTGNRVTQDVGKDPNDVDYEGISFDGFNYDPSFGFRGLDVMRPRGSFSVTINPTDSKVTRNYQNLVTTSVGKVNEFTYRTYEPGEVMLVSARGGARNRTDWEFTFNFEVRRNRPTVDLGNGVVLSNVQGWDIIDPYYVEHIVQLGSDSAAFNVCRQAIVWRLYEQIDFNALTNPT